MTVTTEQLICKGLYPHKYSGGGYAAKRKVIVDGDLEIDAETGEVIGCVVDYGKR